MDSNEIALRAFLSHQSNTANNGSNAGGSYISWIKSQYPTQVYYVLLASYNIIYHMRVCFRRLLMRKTKFRNGKMIMRLVTLSSKLNPTV